MTEKKICKFVYRPKNYPSPIALDAKPSQACKEYHENSKIQINIENSIFLKNILKKEV